MELLTQEVESALRSSPLYSHEKEGLDALVAVKYFLPVGAATWLITEGEPQSDGDWLLFGYACLFPGEWEWGYVMLSQLRAIRDPHFGLGVEQDLYLSAGTTVRQAAGLSAKEAVA